MESFFETSRLIAIRYLLEEHFTRGARFETRIETRVFSVCCLNRIKSDLVFFLENLTAIFLTRYVISHKLVYGKIIY